MSFFVNGALVRTLQLTDGAATLTGSFSPGDDALRLQYAGAIGFLKSTSATRNLHVT